MIIPRKRVLSLYYALASLIVSAPIMVSAVASPEAAAVESPAYEQQEDRHGTRHGHDDSSSVYIPNHASEGSHAEPSFGAQGYHTVEVTSENGETHYETVIHPRVVEHPAGGEPVLKEYVVTKTVNDHPVYEVTQRTFSFFSKKLIREDTVSIDQDYYSVLLNPESKDSHKVDELFRS